MLGIPQLLVEGLQVLPLHNWLSQSSPWDVVVMCSRTGVWWDVDFKSLLSVLSYENF